MVFQLLYVSGATAQMGEAEIRTILDASRRNNGRLGISGMLLYADRVFLQLLEGERAIVRKLFNKIGLDARHRNVMTMMELESASRAFGEWQMGFSNLSASMAEHEHAFRISRNALENRIAIGDGGVVLDTVLAFAGSTFLDAR